jgi:hypothetical protein
MRKISMREKWDEYLPDEYRGRAMAPDRFEHFADASARSEKIVGYRGERERCFYCHEFLITEERFDEEDMPFLVKLYRERVFAWRLEGDTWLKLKVCADRLDECGKRVTLSRPEIGKESGSLR